MRQQHYGYRRRGEKKSPTYQGNSRIVGRLNLGEIALHKQDVGIHDDGQREGDAQDAQLIASAQHSLGLRIARAISPAGDAEKEDGSADYGYGGPDR